MADQAPRVLVTGSSGFIGRALAKALMGSGTRPRCLVRRRDSVHYLPAGVEIAEGDVLDYQSLREALRGIEVAYYLVHSLDSPQFKELDRAGAKNFAAAADDTGLSKVIFVGALRVTGQPSAHLASRYEVEELLGRARAPLTTMRVGLIIGAGSATYRMLRDVVLRLPVLPSTPQMAARVQPIALEDMLRYLMGMLQKPETARRAFDAGGPDVVTYVDLLREIVFSLRRTRLIVPAPAWLEILSTWCVVKLTGVDRQVAKTLFESMAHDLVCRDRDVQALFPGNLLTVREALTRAALDSE